MKDNNKQKVLVTSPRSKRKIFQKVGENSQKHKTVIISGSSDNGDNSIGEMEF